MISFLKLFLSFILFSFTTLVHAAVVDFTAGPTNFEKHNDEKSFKPTHFINKKQITVKEKRFYSPFSFLFLSQDNNPLVDSVSQIRIISFLLFKKEIYYKTKTGLDPPQSFSSSFFS